MKKFELVLTDIHLSYLKGLLLTDIFFSKQLLNEDNFKDEDEKFLVLSSLKLSKSLYDKISSALEDN